MIIHTVVSLVVNSDSVMKSLVVRWDAVVVYGTADLREKCTDEH